MVGSDGSDMRPELRNDGAARGFVDAVASGVIAGVCSFARAEDGVLVLLVEAMLAHPPTFLNPPPAEAEPAAVLEAGSTTFAPPRVVVAAATGANPPPPPPNLAQPPPFFGGASAAPTDTGGASFGATAMPTPTPPETATPAAPIFLAISLASRLRSFSRRRSVSPEALLRSRSAALSATAPEGAPESAWGIQGGLKGKRGDERARWWWSYELVCSSYCPTVL